MKKLFTLSLLALISVQFSFAQEAGFYPPEGSTYNADSTVVTLPAAYLESNYSDTIVFYVSESFSIDLAGTSMELPFNFAQITSVTTPNGMDYSCNPENCYFEPNTSGEVVLYGTPTDIGPYELELTAFVSIDATPLGLAMDIEFEIPYTGGNALLELALGSDYSVINSVVPTFLINVEPVLSGCTNSLACNFHKYASIDDGTCVLPDTDACETCSGQNDGSGVVVNIGDTDSDLICDDVDNCIDISNTDQFDTDVDGEGDLCDYDDGLVLEELVSNHPTLVRMIDILGAEHAIHPKGKLMFYIYNDGSIKKEIRY